MADRVQAALFAEGIDEQVLKQVRIVLDLPDGSTVEAIADYAYRIDDTIHFGEVKFGMEAKMTPNQKVVYRAIASGAVRIVNQEQALALRVGVNAYLRSATVTLHAMEGSRAWKQFGRIVPTGSRKALGIAVGILASTPVMAADMFFMTNEYNEYNALLMSCPACSPHASYGLR